VCIESRSGGTVSAREFSLVDKATNRDLKQALKSHLEETRKQIERLDQVFKKLGQEPKGIDCPAIDGRRRLHARRRQPESRAN
jgi:ferritin-like metal-binding protein YciE